MNGASARAAALGLVALSVVACGGDGAARSRRNGGSSAAGTGAGAMDGGVADSAGVNSNSGSACPTGNACGDGGVCAGGACCPEEHACKDACCGGEEVCSFGRCLVPGDDCEDSFDCADEEYCDHALADLPDGGLPLAPADAGGICMGGAATLKGKCLLDPPPCEEGPDDDCLPACEFAPPPTVFDPVVKYHWDKADVMMSPVVVQLDDDDCDGRVTGQDIPDIAFVSFAAGAYWSAGTLHVVSAVGGQLVEKWTAATPVHGSSGLAAADIDEDGEPEIVACAAPAPSGGACCDDIATRTPVIAFNADGTVQWTQSDTTRAPCGYAYPAVAKPWPDKGPVVLVDLALLDGKTGDILQVFDNRQGTGTLSGFSDVDGDGELDVVEGSRAWKLDGTMLWDVRSQIPSGFHAVGDLDADGTPEVVIVSSSNHMAHVVRHDPGAAMGAEIVRTGVDINAGITTIGFCTGATTEYGGGPPTVADFNGDGFPDVGTAGAVGYIVLDGKKLVDNAVTNADTVMWFKQTIDCSSAATGSSVFDFNGDGKAEVIYGDEQHLWMYDGETGDNLIPDTCNTTGTLWEYPLVADVDNDGQADIVVAANAYASTCNGTTQRGIRIFGSASDSWVRTRRIWNQHTYHITNVNEDGSLPHPEIDNWITPGLNNYRQNKQPGGEFAAVDVIVTLRPECGPGGYKLVATVTNLGQAALPDGVLVEFFAGTPPGGDKIGEAQTSKTLFPAESELVILVLADPPHGIDKGETPIYARVTVGDRVLECRPDNNDSVPVSGECIAVE